MKLLKIPVSREFGSAKEAPLVRDRLLAQESRTAIESSVLIMIEHGARKPDFCRKLLLVAVLAAFCQPNVAQSQGATQAAKAAAKVPEFEVASIKPNTSGLGMMRFIFTPDGCSATNISLDFLVSNAYGISRDLISGGPNWIVSSRYDVEAKVAGADVAEWHRLDLSQRNSMLQPLLADRFKLRVHKETKLLSIYELVIAKNGPKLKEAKPGDTDTSGTRGANRFSRPGTILIATQGMSIATLANRLSELLHSTIVDKTGLTGKYDIMLEWTSEDGPAPMPPGPGGDQRGTDSAPPPDSGPSIFTAIQEQLGLKLQSTKGPVETLVIDHVEQLSEN